MFELRWVIHDYKDYQPPLKSAVLSSDSTYRRLQYRIQTNPNETGIQPPIWSDWIDVPVEDL